MASEPKTRPTDASVADYLAALQPANRREDAQAACALLQDITGEPPVMWGSSIVGFGSYQGPTGDWPVIGFAARKAELVFYCAPGAEDRSDLLARLGRHRTGVSCVYVKRLSELDPGALRELLTWSIETVHARYPA